MRNKRDKFFLPVYEVIVLYSFIIDFFIEIQAEVLESTIDSKVSDMR